MSKIGLFGKLFKKKDNPVPPDPIATVPPKPVIPTKTDNFKVAGISSYMDNLMELASENDEEAKQAKDYAVNKLKTTAKVENLKDKLLKTSKTAAFKDLNIRG